VAGLARYHQAHRLETLKAHDWWQVAVFDQGMTFHLFGDPTLRLLR
jgi:hypothetical protein